MFLLFLSWAFVFFFILSYFVCLHCRTLNWDDSAGPFPVLSNSSFPKLASLTISMQGNRLLNLNVGLLRSLKMLNISGGGSESTLNFGEPTVIALSLLKVDSFQGQALNFNSLFVTRLRVSGYCAGDIFSVLKPRAIFASSLLGEDDATPSAIQSLKEEYKRKIGEQHKREVILQSSSKRGWCADCCGNNSK